MAREVYVSQITTAQWDFKTCVENYARTDGIDGIGVWPDKLSEIGTKEGARLVRDAGLAVSSLVFVAGFTQDLQGGVEEGRKAVDDAHELGTKNLLVVAGPRLGVGVEEGDRLAREGLEELSEEAGEAGVALALEALHPVDVTRFSTIVTLDQALNVTEGIPNTGVIFDTWNVWWDPGIVAATERAVGRISLVHLADWRHPDKGNPRDRAVPGEGVAPLGKLAAGVAETGYDGPYAVELFTDQYGPDEYPKLLEDCVRGVQNVLESAGIAGGGR